MVDLMNSSFFVINNLSKLLATIGNAMEAYTTILLTVDDEEHTKDKRDWSLLF